MKAIKQVIALFLVGIMVIVSGINANAEEAPLRSTTHTAVAEEDSVNIEDLIGEELKDGDVLQYGEYTIKVSKKIVCNDALTSRANSQTKVYQSITTYGVYSPREEWYKITQTTNYTYDGNSVKINIGEGLTTVKVEEYKSECSYRVLQRSVNNSNSKAATFTITVSMNLPNGWLRITDVVTAYPDGTAGVTSHTES